MFPWPNRASGKVAREGPQSLPVAQCAQQPIERCQRARYTHGPPEWSPDGIAEIRQALIPAGSTPFPFRNVRSLSQTRQQFQTEEATFLYPVALDIFHVQLECAIAGFQPREIGVSQITARLSLLSDRRFSSTARKRFPFVGEVLC